MKWNNHLRAVGLATVLSCMMTTSVFAADTKKEYHSEAEPIQKEIQAVKTELKSLQELHMDYAEKYREFSENYRSGAESETSKENRKLARELRSQIKNFNRTENEFSAKEIRDEIRAMLQEGDYDSALDKLEQILEFSQFRAEQLKEKIQIWEQIDSLIL